MTDRDNKQSDGATNQHLDDSVLSGRITQAEAEVIRSFFASKPQEGWPTSNLQRRMQSTGG